MVPYFLITAVIFCFPYYAMILFKKLQSKMADFELSSRKNTTSFVSSRSPLHHP
ncbi:hypothetical protein Hanom_Chr11g00983871 [Helianthus anomalus]